MHKHNATRREHDPPRCTPLFRSCPPLWAFAPRWIAFPPFCASFDRLSAPNNDVLGRRMCQEACKDMIFSLGKAMHEVKCLSPGGSRFGFDPSMSAAAANATIRRNQIKSNSPGGAVGAQAQKAIVLSTSPSRFSTLHHMKERLSKPSSGPVYARETRVSWGDSPEGKGGEGTATSPTASTSIQSSSSFC